MILHRPRAIDAIIELAEYIGQDSPASANRFMDAVEATLADLESAPAIGKPYASENPVLAGIRLRQVQGFPNHLVFYRPLEDGVELLTLMHGARDIPAAIREDLEM